MSNRSNNHEKICRPFQKYSAEINLPIQKKLQWGLPNSQDSKIFEQ